MMKIIEIRENKKAYLPLLLLGDEQETMIDRYLERGDMYVMADGGSALAVCVVTDEGDSILEIKNLAVDPASQRKGLGRRMIEFVADRYCDRFDALIVGTGDSPLTVPFYERCGFVRFHVVRDFFLKHYDHPIIEAGVVLRDMVYFRRRLKRA